MSRIKIISVLLALSLALAGLMTGCGSSYAPQVGYDGSAASSAAEGPSFRNSSAILEEFGSTTNGNDMAMDSAAPQAPAESTAPNAPPTADTAPAPDSQPRKLVKNGYLSLETKNFDEAMTGLVSTVEQSGGYIDQQAVDGQSLRYKEDYYERSATITARVPAHRLDEVTGKLGELCHIVSKSESVSDITDQYYDAQSRLDTLKVKEARLQELLAKAEKLEDIIQLESALSDCQYQLDSLTGQLRRMDSLVSFSTLEIELREVVEYQEPTSKPATFGERLMESLRYSGRSIQNTLENCLFWLIEDGPQLLILLFFWGTIFYLLYRLWRRLSKKKATGPSQVTPYSYTPPTPVAEPAADASQEDAPQ